MTPAEMYTGTESKLTFAKLFGTFGYIYINVHKLGEDGAKAEEDHLVGMSSKRFITLPLSQSDP